MCWLWCSETADGRLVVGGWWSATSSCGRKRRWNCTDWRSAGVKGRCRSRHAVVSVRTLTDGCLFGDTLEFGKGLCNWILARLSRTALGLRCAWVWRSDIEDVVTHAELISGSRIFGVRSWRRLFGLPCVGPVGSTEGRLDWRSGCALCATSTRRCRSPGVAVRWCGRIGTGSFVFLETPATEG